MGDSGAGIYIDYASLAIIFGTTIGKNAAASGESRGIFDSGGGPGAPGAALNLTAAQSSSIQQRGSVVA